MAEVLAHGVIEIAGDARKLRASIEEAKRSLKSLGEGQRDISKSASASIDRYVGSLHAQNATLGKSVRETELYKLALRGASDQQLKAADAALRFADTQAKNAQTLQSLKSGLIAFGAIAVAAVGAAALAFDNLVKSASNFQDLAEKTGDSAEAIASLAVAAKVGGIGINEVADASVRLTKNLTGVDDEADAAGAALKSLGLNIADFKGLSPSDQIQAIANALAGFEEGAGKAAVAVALFGKAGAQMLPFLKELAAGTGRVNILTKEQIALADEYADRQARVRAQLELHAQAIAVDMLPAYVDLQGAFLDVIKGMSGVGDGASGLAKNTGIQDFANNAARAFAFVLDSLDGIVRAFQIAGKSIGGFGAVMERITRLDFRGAIEAASAFREDIGAVLNRQTFQGALEARIAQRNAPGITNQTPPRDRPTLNFQGPKKKPAGGGDDSAQLARAQLQFDLEQIKAAGDAQTEAFRRAEQIMQAMRSASLVDDREYFASKLAFIQTFAREEEAALQAQIERRQREVFTGKNADKDRLDNEREIIKLQAQIAKIRADSVAKIKINSIEEAAALEKIRQGYIEAEKAAQAYLETVARRNAREIEGIGRGQRFREINAGRGEIDDRLLAERRRLEGEQRRGQINQQQFDTYLARAQDTYRREIEMYEERTAAIERAQGDWLNGAREALQNYIDESKNLAKQFEDVFSRGFQNLEDLLIDFGNLNFKTWKDAGAAVGKFVTGIANDIARIEIRKNITGPLAEWLQKDGRLEGIGGALGFPRAGGGGGGLVDSGGPIEHVPSWLNVLLGRTSRGGATGGGIAGVAGAANPAAFQTAITTAGTTFSTSVQTAGTTLSTEISTSGATFQGEVTASGTTFSGSATTAGTAITTSGATFAGEVTGAASLFAGQVEAAAVAFASTVQSGSAVSGASSIFSGGAGLGESLFSGFFAEGGQVGGQVSGPGTSTSDSVPAMLSNQEFVVRAAKVTEPGALPFLKKMNRSGLAAALSDLRERDGAQPHGVVASTKANVLKFATGGLVKAPKAASVAAQAAPAAARVRAAQPMIAELPVAVTVRPDVSVPDPKVTALHSISRERVEREIHSRLILPAAAAAAASVLSMPLAAAPVPSLSTVNNIAGDTSISNSTIAAVAPVAPAPAAVPFVGSFERGIAFVPQTGLAMIHKGEGILNREQNRERAESGQLPQVNVTINQSYAPGTSRETVNQGAAAAGMAVRRAQARAFAAAVK